MAKEHDFQKQAVDLLRRFGVLVISADVMDGLKFLPAKDGRARSMFVNHHKAMGYLPGQPDLMIFGQGGRVWFFELKTRKGAQRETQKMFEEICIKKRIPYGIWRDIDEVYRWYNNNRGLL